jgi:hypothetical protein
MHAYTAFFYVFIRRNIMGLEGVVTSGLIVSQEAQEGLMHQEDKTDS